MATDHSLPYMVFFVSVLSYYGGRFKRPHPIHIYVILKEIQRERDGYREKGCGMDDTDVLPQLKKRFNIKIFHIRSKLSSERLKRQK